MFKYKKADGTIVNVTEAKVQEFLLAYPDATLVEESIEPGKQTSQGQGAPAAGTAAPEIQVQSTDSTLENGSSELQDSFVQINGQEKSPITASRLGVLPQNKPELKDKTVIKIDGNPYSVEEIETTAKQYNLTLNQYLNSLQKDRSRTEKTAGMRSRVEIIYPEIVTKLDEFIGTPKNTSLKRKNNKKIFDEINNKSKIHSETEIAEEAANVYFGLDAIEKEYKKDFQNKVVLTSKGPAPGVDLDINKDKFYKNILGNKYDDYVSWKETGVFEISDEQSQNTAEKIAENTLQKRKLRNAIDDLPEGQQEDMRIFNENFDFETPQQAKKYAEEVGKELQDNNKYLVKLNEDLTEQAAPFVAGLDNLSSELQKINKQLLKEPNSKDLLALHDQKVEEITNLFNNNKDLIYSVNNLVNIKQRQSKDIEAYYDKIGNLKDEGLMKEALDYDYNLFSRINQRTAEFTVGGVAGTVKLAADILSALDKNYSSAKFGLPTASATSVFDIISNEASIISKGIKEEGKKIPAPLEFKDQKYGASFMDVLLEIGADNAPSTILSGLGGLGAAAKGVGLLGKVGTALSEIGKTTIPTFFISSTGTKYNDLKEAQELAPRVVIALQEQLKNTNLTEFEVNQIKKELNYQTELQDYGLIRTGGSAIAYGGFEAGFEQFGNVLIGKSARRFLTTAGVKGVLPKLGRKTIGAGVMAGVENIEEIGTQLSQNLLDRDILGMDVSLLDGFTPEFFAGTTFSTLLAGGGINSMTLTNSLVNAGKSKVDQVLFKKYLKEYYNLQESLNPENQKDVQEQMGNVLKKAATLNQYIATNLDNFSESQAKELFDVDAKINKIYREVAQLASTDNFKIGDEATRKRVKNLKDQLQGLSNKKNAIIKSVEKATVPDGIKSVESIFAYQKSQINKKMAQAAGNTLIELDENDFSLGILNEKGINKLKKADYFRNKTDENVFSEVSDMMQFSFDEKTGQPIIKTQYGKILPDGKTKILNSAAINNAIENAESNEFEAATAAIAPLHETLHEYTSSKNFIFKDKKRFNEAVEELKNILKNKKENNEIKESVYNLALARMDRYKKEGLKDTQLNEEFQNLYYELLQNGYIKQSDLENKAYQFSNYISGIRSQALGAFGINAGASEIVGRAQDIILHLNSFNDFVQSGKRIKFYKEELEDEKLSLGSDSSLKVQEIFDEKGINGVMEIVKEYKPMAANIANKYRDRPGFTTYKEDLIDSILMDPTYGVVGLTLNYKPNENIGVPLAAYINKYLAPRSITIANQLLGKDEASTFKFDVTEAKDIIATETSEDAVNVSEEIAKEKPVQKKALLSEKIKFTKELDESFVKNINKAIVLNIKKFNIETTKNRTITPFVADLKKDIADFAEKDILKFIKEKGLEQFLIDNREAFLNNFTTTFLSKHPFFRKGILKRVNGEWVAPTKISEYKYDWIDEKGNKLKIDRDNAAGRGMTSGPEFIKRNPKIKEAVKENEYVDYHFQDGALRNKIKTNAISSLARQIASEKGFEVILKDLSEGGILTESIANISELYTEIKAEEVIDGMEKTLPRGIAKLSLGADIEFLKDLSPEKQALFLNGFKNVLRTALNDGNFEEAYKIIFSNKFSDIEKNNILNLVGAIKDNYIDIGRKLINQKYKSTNEFLDFIDEIDKKDFDPDQVVSAVVGLPYFGLSPNKQENKDRGKAFIQKWWNLYSFKTPNATKSQKETQMISMLKTLNKPWASGVNKTLFGNNQGLLDAFDGILTKNFKAENVLDSKTKEIIGTSIYYKNKNIYKFTPLKPFPGSDDLIGADPKQINVEGRTLEVNKSKVLFDDLHATVKKLYNSKDPNLKIDLTTVGLIYAGQLKHMSTPLKNSYDLSYITKNLNSKGIKYVYEHMLPALLFANLSIGNVIGRISDEQFENIKKLRIASLTQKSFDTTLNSEMNVKNSMNKGFDFFNATPLDVLQRYFENLPSNINLQIIGLPGMTNGEIITKESYNNKETSKASLGMSIEFNKMLERKKGISENELISNATAKKIGEGKGKLKIFIPPGADDFAGLLYNFYGTGKQGDADMKFMDEKLLKPLARANFNLNAERQLIKQSYHNLIKANKGITKKLRAESDYKYYSNDDAVRVYMWSKLGYDVPGISQTDKNALIKSVVSDMSLLTFAEDLINVPNKKESWLKPEEDWTASTIEMDLQEILSKIGRARIFEKFITNADIIFSKENINKIEAAYGPDLRSALEDMLYRIKNGRARQIGNNKLANAYLDWVRGSVGVTMFFNTRSALLQQLSIVNFTNWEDNNIFAQGKFIAGSPATYAKYWVDIFNSDWMKERRQGLKTDINESELVARLEGSKNKNKALLSYILEKGFSLTKYGDNIAVATGGAPFLYNREQKYIKEGMSEAKAKEEAFLDFQEIAERTQQSSRQDLLSNQQVSVIGRIFLAFQNTTMQMTRIQKKAMLDLINRRGSFKANVSRLVYYGAIQNTIFAFLQNALFAGVFGDDEDEDLKIDKKTERAINTMLDSALRGSGIGGAALATLKNATIAWMRENDKGFTGQNGKVIIELLNISPAVGIKARKIYGAMENYKFNKKILDKIGYDNPNHPYYQIGGNLVSAAFNFPLDRVLTKVSNIKAITQQDAEAWQRTALFLGYNSWDIGLKDPEIEKARNAKKRKGGGLKSGLKGGLKRGLK